MRATHANSRAVLGDESTGRDRGVHRDDWVLGVADEERRRARPKLVASATWTWIDSFFGALLLTFTFTLNCHLGKTHDHRSRGDTPWRAQTTHQDHTQAPAFPGKWPPKGGSLNLPARMYRGWPAAAAPRPFSMRMPPEPDSNVTPSARGTHSAAGLSVDQLQTLEATLRPTLVLPLQLLTVLPVTGAATLCCH